MDDENEHGKGLFLNIKEVSLPLVNKILGYYSLLFLDYWEQQ